MFFLFIAERATEAKKPWKREGCIIELRGHDLQRETISLTKIITFSSGNRRAIFKNLWQIRKSVNSA